MIAMNYVGIHFKAVLSAGYAALDAGPRGASKLTGREQHAPPHGGFQGQGAVS